MRSYFCFYGTQRREITAESLLDARNQALAWVASMFAPGIAPPQADEVRVRPVRDDELAGV